MNQGVVILSTTIRFYTFYTYTPTIVQYRQAGSHGAVLDFFLRQ